MLIETILVRGRVGELAGEAITMGRPVSGRRSVTRGARWFAVSLLALAISGCGPSVSKLAASGDVAGLVEIAEEPGQDFMRVSEAADAIGEIRTHEAVEVLVRWVTGDDASLQTAAIPALGATGDPAGIEPLAGLIGTLDETDTNMYEMELRAIVTALGGIDDPRSADVLLAQVDADRSHIVGEAYLGRALAGQGEDIKPELIKRLTRKGSEQYLPCGVALYVLNAEDKGAVSEMLRSEATQRVWAGVFTEGAEYGFKDDLAYALKKFGDKGLATRMLNTKDEAMEKAARQWAAKNGYMVQELLEFGVSQ